MTLRAGWWHRSAVAVVVLLLTVVTGRAASAASWRVTLQLPDGITPFHVGVDDARGGGTCGAAYDAVHWYAWPTPPDDACTDHRSFDGTVDVVPGSDGARLELYPGDGGRYYDAWGDVGGVAVRVQRADQVGLGLVPVPRRGAPGTGRLVGSLVARTPVVDAQVSLAVFQVSGQPRSSGGVPVDGFNAVTNDGGRWTTGWVFAGDYIVFVDDLRTGASAVATVAVPAGEHTLDLDLDAVCFGLDECDWDETPLPDRAGRFHPVTPTRLLDTRNAAGDPRGSRPYYDAVTGGDGRTSDPNGVKREALRRNHELVVAGVAGVPVTGTAAVLLNVTSVAPPGPGYLTVFPKPPRLDWFQDQSSFTRPPPLASNLNYVPGADVPNLVLAKVGVGGRVRLHNFGGSTHVVVDLLGWFDRGGGGGSRLVPVEPTRLLDTRDGTGPTEPRPFGTGETRRLLLAGRGPVPTGATAVVANVTAVVPSGPGYVTVFPAGVDRPLASNLNLRRLDTRPNLVVVPVGADGGIALYNDQGTTHLLVDVVGYLTEAAGEGGLTTPTDPTRLLDTREGLGGAATPIGPGETRLVPIAGRGPVPAGAAGVWLNVTVTGQTAPSHLTVAPAGGELPTASNLNWAGREDRPNLVLVKLGADGRIALRNHAGATHVIADVVGWVS